MKFLFPLSQCVCLFVYIYFQFRLIYRSYLVCFYVHFYGPGLSFLCRRSQHRYKPPHAILLQVLACLSLVSYDHIWSSCGEVLYPWVGLMETLLNCFKIMPGLMFFFVCAKNNMDECFKLSIQIYNIKELFFFYHGNWWWGGESN